MAETADVVVVGLGAVGSAALHRLAASGADVVGIDRFHPPHDRGSSHGESRITRMAVGEGEAYAPLVRRSHAIWRELEAETGERLMLQTGGLVMGAPGSGATHHGTANFIDRTIAVARANAVVHEVLAADEIAARFPQFRLRGNEFGVYEPSAGVLFPERCIAAQLRLAERLGARLHLGEQVQALRPLGDGVEVVTDRRVVQAGRAILAAGPWVAGLAGRAVAQLTGVYRQTLHWFELETPAGYAPGRFPVFIWMQGNGNEDYIYGFPALDGASNLKLATERYGGTVAPDMVERRVSEAESEAFFARHVGGWLAGVLPSCSRAAACLYTVTPDSGFIIDALPEIPSVLVASACSGHGFKHSPALGELLAARTLAGPDATGGPFSLSRFR
jgi:sarcosine oxidase